MNRRDPYIIRMYKYLLRGHTLRSEFARVRKVDVAVLSDCDIVSVVDRLYRVV